MFTVQTDNSLYSLAPGKVVVEVAVDVLVVQHQHKSLFEHRYRVHDDVTSRFLYAERNVCFSSEGHVATYDWFTCQRGVFDETSQGTAVISLFLFKESESFEDAVRRAVSFGGDSDTLGAVVGSLAEAYYGVTEKQRQRPCNKAK